MMNQPSPLLDTDTPEYVTLAQAMEYTGRSRRTILRWHAAGQVERIRREGMRVYNLWDLQIQVVAAEQQQQATRFT
jgi:hypothetical protein